MRTLSHRSDGDRHGEEGMRPRDPVDHVPDSATSSETTPRDPNDSETGEFSGTGVPGVASDSAESLPPGDTGVGDPQEAMETRIRGRAFRRLRTAARKLSRRRPDRGA